MPQRLIATAVLDLKQFIPQRTKPWRCQLRRGVRTPKPHHRLLRCSAAAQSPAAQKPQARTGVEHPTLRVAALITAIGTKNTEPPGAGDTTETSLPPSEQSISRDDAASARRPLTTHHTGPRPRRHSFVPKRGPVTTPQMTSPNIYACGTHLLALAEDPSRLHTLQPHKTYLTQ